MKCAWKELLDILPPGLRQQIKPDDLWEIRLRLDRPTELVGAGGSRWLPDRSTREDLRFVVNIASRYSPWTAQTMARATRMQRESTSRIPVTCPLSTTVSPPRPIR